MIYATLRLLEEGQDKSVLDRQKQYIGKTVIYGYQMPHHWNKFLLSPEAYQVTQGQSLSLSLSLTYPTGLF